MTYYQNPYYPALLQQPMVYQQLLEQQQQQQPNDSFFIWVQGEAGAKSYPVARGTTVPLFDSEGDFVYFKSVDNNGVPLPLVTKVISDPVKEEPVPQMEVPSYITMEAYEQLKKQCEDLELRIMELETRPPQIQSTFTGNTFNNSRKGENGDGNKFSV